MFRSELSYVKEKRSCVFFYFSNKQIIARHFVFNLRCFFSVACSSLVASSHMSECDPDVPSRPLPTAKHKRQRICNEGHYFDGHCKRCEGGTFMTSQMAKSRRYHRCLPCLQPIENEIIHHPCSITRDTVIFCSEGYFRNISGNTCTFQCAKCSKCGTVTNKNQFEQKPCFGYRDTVCCEKEEQLDGAECAGSDSPSLPKTTTTTTDTPTLFYGNQALLSTAHFCDANIPSRPFPKPVVRVQLSTKCEDGQYVDGHRCVPCDDGTFMTSLMAKKGTYHKCIPCLTPQKDEAIYEPCTKTKDTTIMSHDGFYRNRSADIPCMSQCLRCDICGIGRNMYKPKMALECQGFQNSICCPNNTVVKAGQCVHETGAVWSHLSIMRRCLVSPVYHGALSGLTCQSCGAVWSHLPIMGRCLVSLAHHEALSGLTCLSWGAVWSHLPIMGRCLVSLAHHGALSGLTCPSWGAVWSHLPIMGRCLVSLAHHGSLSGSHVHYLPMILPAVHTIMIY
ncbi:hypothetical protein Btru_026839 [Bulinus truncatus]|nr:hypothetical protein Btru_026839 [Bulinus truncatus]